MTQQFKIKKQGGNFVAYDMVDPKRSYGKINIKTGRFVGATVCSLALYEHLEAYRQESLLKRKVHGTIDVIVPILKDLNENDEGFSLNIGAVTLSRKDRNFIIDSARTNYKNRMKAGSTLTFDTYLEVDTETFSPEDNNGDYNYKLTEEDLLSGEVTATFFMSDEDVSTGEDCFDFDKTVMELLVYVDGRKYRINRVEFE